MAFRNIVKGRHNSRHYPVNSETKSRKGVGKYFRLDAQKQVWALNHPIYMGSVTLTLEGLTVVQKSYQDIRKKTPGY